jgi:phosphatidylglycerophosphate synthase
MTFTSFIGTICMFPLRAIIAASVALRIHPNVLTLIGVLINVVAAAALGVDRFSDIALFLGLIYLYADLRRTDYVMVAALAMMFTIMTSYARARAESLIDKCKVGFMERPERIVLFMIGAFTDRMAAVLWVILVLSIVTVANRIHYTYLVLNAKPMPAGSNPLSALFWRAFFWRDERGTTAYDLWVIAILAFVWLTPPDWLDDPTASGLGLWTAMRLVARTLDPLWIG